MKPRWQEIEKENPWLITKYYDYDTDQEVFKKHKIGDIIPVFIFLDKNDNEIIRLTGEIDKSKLINLINQNRER